MLPRTYIKPSSQLKKGWFYYWMLDHWVISSGEFAGQKYSFENYPFLVDVAKDDSMTQVAMKSAQIGYTELMIARMFATADLLPGNLLYVLPTDDLAKNVARGRIREAPFKNEYLEKRLTGFDTLQQFKFKNNYIYIRGSQTQLKDNRVYQRQLITLDISKLFGDEVDEWNMGVFGKLQSRQGAAFDPFSSYFTTPRLPDGEMSKLFGLSDQKYWGIKCRSCGFWNVPLELEVNVDNFEYPDMSHHFLCSHCKRILDRLENDPKYAQWIPLKQDVARHSGYHFSKLFFRQANIDTIVDRFNDPETQTECYNDDLGLPHMQKEYQLKDDVISRMICPTPSSFSELVAQAREKRIGVDIGKVLHVTVRGDLPNEKNVLVDFFTTQSFAEVESYCYEHGIRYGICDAQPDFRASLEFCEKMCDFGDFRVAYYDNWVGISKEKVLVKEESSNEFVVTIARNLAMSKVMFELVSARLFLPPDVRSREKGDFIAHIKEPKRIFRKENRTGQTVVVFPPTRKPDHFYHSLVYSKCAGNISEMQVVVNVGSGVLV